MTCDFSYRHYKEILNLALKQGYDFRDFQSAGLGGEAPTLYLRHDIDIDIIGAIELAQIEHRLGVTATYFFMIDSPIYNPFGDLERYCIDTIKKFGHKIGLHIDAAGYSTRHIETLLEILRAVLPLDRVVSFHKPTDEILGKTFPHYTSVYEPRFFGDIKYVSDSRGQWREGCPCQWLDGEKYPRVQMLIHPIHWGTLTSTDNARKIVANKVSDMKQYLKTIHLEI